MNIGNYIYSDIFKIIAEVKILLFLHPHMASNQNMNKANSWCFHRGSSIS